jgi:TM2 domain-containing membrane protein YozV
MNGFVTTRCFSAIIGSPATAWSRRSAGARFIKPARLITPEASAPPQSQGVRAPPLPENNTMNIFSARPRWEAFDVSFTLEEGGRTIRQSAVMEGHGARDAIERGKLSHWAKNIEAHPVRLRACTHSRGVAVLLCLLLGGIGGQRFYLGTPFIGLLYVLFCWTFIPLILSALEFLILLLMTDAAFRRAYGGI